MIYSKEKWLELAKKIVIEQGVDAVNVNMLSRKLGVSKTSFYHFFDSKANFMDILFRFGMYDSTDMVMEEVYRISDPKKRFEGLMDIVFDENLDNELFIRRFKTHGFYHKKVARYISETEKRRMEFVKDLFVGEGMSESEASQKAVLFYTYALGLYERYYADPEVLKDLGQVKTEIYNMLK